MHACGHDMHVTGLIGAATLFAKTRDAWKGTLLAVFQASEEIAIGAQAMIDDRLFERFPTPDVVLGQYVMVASSGGALERSLRPATACKSESLAGALTGPCRRPASIPW
jgi:metal-dependent amidase/aminoacylase/carboxypeptidase family protein